MLIHQIGKKEYRIKTDWTEMTWSDADKALDVEIPSDVREKMKGEIVEYNDWLISDGVFDYGRKILGALSDIPDSKRVSPQDCLFYFMYYHMKLIADMLSAVPVTYRPRGIKTVPFKGRVYNMPESLMIGEDEIPMAGETSDNFVEASNILRQYGLLKDRGIKHLNYFTAVYLREQGEGYDEARIAERAELFKGLTMDIYWEVFFCIQRLSARRINDTHVSLMAQAKRARWALRLGSLRLLNPVYWVRSAMSRK
jgi:hypothetical protein